MICKRCKLRKATQGTSQLLALSIGTVGKLSALDWDNIGRLRLTKLALYTLLEGASVCPGLPESDVPQTPKEAMGILAQRMQISLECARDAAGLQPVNTQPPEQLSANRKAMIHKVDY